MAKAHKNQTETLEQKVARLERELNLVNAKNSIIYGQLCKYKNEIDFVNKLILIYSITNKPADEQLRNFEKDVLNYYVRFGYSTETKKRVEKELKKKPDAITQATFHLSKKGYLVPSKTNMSKKNLNKELQAIRKNFLEGNKKVMAIGFKRK